MSDCDLGHLFPDLPAIVCIDDVMEDLPDLPQGTPIQRCDVHSDATDLEMAQAVAARTGGTVVTWMHQPFVLPPLKKT